MEWTLRKEYKGLFADLGEEDREVCVYGLNLLLLTIFDYMVLILAAVVMHKFLYGILFLLVYSSIRSQAGGYHANGKIRCLLFFFVAFVLCLIIPDFIQHVSVVIYVLLCIMIFIIVIWLAPVESIGIPIGRNQKKKMKRRAVLILGCNITVTSILYAFQSEGYIYMLLAMLWLAYILIIGKIKITHRRKNHE